MPEFSPDFTPDDFTSEQMVAQGIQNPASVRWNDQPGPISGSTPFGIYDADPKFQIEGPQAARWAARRLGFPITDVEMVDVNFYACLEEAVSDYSTQVNQFNIRENISLLQGLPVTTNVTQQNVQGTGLPYIITLSKAYSTEVGTGGNVDWKHVAFETTPGVGEYDLQAVIGDNLEGGNRIEIKRVFHKEMPASRIFAPFATTGLLGGGEGQPIDLLQELGGGASGGWQFFMTPVFEDLLRWQAVEFNQQMRRSLFSFELVNNKIRIFPLPTHRFKIWVDYIVEKDRAAQVIFDSNGNVPANASNTTNPTGSTNPVEFNPQNGSWGGQKGTVLAGRLPAATSTQLDNLWTFGEDEYIGPVLDPYLITGDPNWPGDQANWPGNPPLIPPAPTPTVPSGSNNPPAQPVIGDYSNVPYNFIPYSNINDVGKQWIRKYFLATCKEVLGTIRAKYSTIPAPGSEVTLDGAELRAEASQEKEELIRQLRENLEASGRSAQMENKAQQGQQLQESLMKVPLFIYVG